MATEICSHELFDLSFSFDSMHCKKCRTSFKVPDWFRVFAHAAQQRIESVEDHVERIVEGLIGIDVVPCEKCGTFFRSGSAEGFDRYDSVVCVECLPEWYDQANDNSIDCTLVRWFLQRREAVKNADIRTAHWIAKTFPDEIQRQAARA